MKIHVKDEAPCLIRSLLSIWAVPIWAALLIERDQKEVGKETLSQADAPPPRKRAKNGSKPTEVREPIGEFIKRHKGERFVLD